MDNLESTDKFADWLRDNSNLSESSISLYARTIRHFLNEYNNLTKDNINKFISSSFRDNNSFYVKYSFKHYLSFINKKHLYNNLIEVKIRPRKKLGTYLPESMIRKIILNISDEIYQDIAMLQYASGARAREIITIKEENIDFDYNKEVIRIRLEGKGGKERVVFLLKKYFFSILKKYELGKAGYLFLNNTIKYAEPEDLERIIATKRTYFYNKLKESTLSLGITNFGTHDFRRNVAELLKRKTKDIRLVQKALGHSSITTTARYFDDNPEDVKAAMVKHQSEDL